MMAGLAGKTPIGAEGGGERSPGPSRIDTGFFQAGGRGDQTTDRPNLDLRWRGKFGDHGREKFEDWECFLGRLWRFEGFWLDDKVEETGVFYVS
jgi:hypothetical protein